MDETKIYLRMKAGDRSAFNQIFKLHYKQLVKFAHRKIDNIAIAEDLVQNVFIDFWTKKDKINLNGVPLPYLKRMVHNRCIDFFRNQKSIENKEKEFFQNNLSLNISTPEEELLTQENLQEIYLKIEALPPKCKIVFKLSRFEEMSYDEIANQLNISKKTVEMHISTALRYLRKSIFISLLFVFLK